MITADPTNVKAYYKRGQAYMAIKDYDKALSDYKIALDLLPNNGMIYKEFENARKKKLNYMEKERELFSKMFQ